MRRRRRAGSAPPPLSAAPAAALGGRRFALLSTAVLAVAALWGAGRLLSPRFQPPDLLLVTIDTLRADRLGCYGAKEAETPFLDALAARGTRFATAVAPTPLTAPSHATILTGLTPLRHGVRDNGGFALSERVPTLAVLLRAAGYRTAAFVSGFPLDRRFGLGRGFDVYDDHLPRGDDVRRAEYVERTADRTTEAVRRWLAGVSATEGVPLFLWVHYFDPHAPYAAPPEVAARFPGRPYEAEVAFVDVQVGRLLDMLDRRGRLRRTVVLATADHGESLGEHGEPTHGIFVYDSTIRVPWIMAGPGIPPGRVAATVARLLDVTPTLLDLAGVRPSATFEGRSLRAAAEGATLPDAPAYVESLFAHLQLGFAPLRGWRTAEWKLVDAPRPELYDLVHDTAEESNRFEQEGERADLLRRLLREAEAEATPSSPRKADRETAERLRALGYVGGPPDARPGGRDPKDGLPLLLQIERGLAEARVNPDLAIRELTAALRDDPHMRLARRYRAIAHAQRGDHRAAVADLRALEAEGPLSADDLVLLGDCLRLAGRGEEAFAALDRAARLDPTWPEPGLTKARALVALGRAEEAAVVYEQVLALVPEHPAALGGMADLALARGDLPRAERFYRRLLATSPDDARTMVRLGVAAVRGGRLEEGIASFREALDVDPREKEGLLALAGALAKSGRPGEAVPYFERAIAAGQRSTAAWNGLGFARLEAGNLPGALDALRSSLQLDPRQAEVAAVVSQLRGSAGGPGQR